MVEKKKVYALQVDYDNYKSFMPSDFSTSIRCKGKPLEWPNSLKIEVDEEDTGMPEADISMLNVGSFVISEFLYNDFFKAFEKDCEFLPISLKDKKYLLVNVINVIDCLDKDKSKFNEFGGVSQLTFDSDKLPKNAFFKISEDNFSSIFCTEEIFQFFHKHKLSGADFEAFPVS